MSEAIMWAATIAAAADAVLAGGLVYVFGRSYRNVNAPFTAGLLLFALFFVAQNVVSVDAYLSFMPLVPDRFSPFLVVIGSLEGAGLALMLRSARV